MSEDREAFSIDRTVEDLSGSTNPLTIIFYVPLKNSDSDDYLARAHISCQFFEGDVYGTGEDAAQAFFSLPRAVVSYLIGCRRIGCETYWLKRGDLDDGDFWG
jgi:hypothetical protein